MVWLLDKSAPEPPRRLDVPGARDTLELPAQLHRVVHMLGNVARDGIVERPVLEGHRERITLHEPWIFGIEHLPGSLSVVVRVPVRGHPADAELAATDIEDAPARVDVDAVT